MNLNQKYIKFLILWLQKYLEILMEIKLKGEKEDKGCLVTSNIKAHKQKWSDV